MIATRVAALRVRDSAREDSSAIRAAQCSRRLIICTGPNDDPQSQQNWELARALSRVGHRAMLVIDRRRIDLAGDHDGVDVRVWPSSIPGRLKDATFFWRLVGEFQPDAILANFQSVNIAMPVGRLRGVRWRIAWHRSLASQTPMDYPRGDVREKLARRAKGALMNCATHVVAVSQAGRRDATESFFVPAHKCAAVFHTCRPDPRKIIHGQPIERSSTRRIVFLGRIVPSKGIDVLLRAVRTLCDREPAWDVELELIGDGTIEREMKALASDLGIGDRVKFLGYLPQKQALARLAAGRVLAVPTRSDPGPGVIPEGLGLGIPVVACAAGGIAELLRHEPAVKMIPVDDVTALADALHAILADETLADRMSREGRELFERKFLLAHWVRDVKHWLEEIIFSGESQ
jgi:glycosyltransferase involved in cell wall biosynthesis